MKKNPRICTNWFNYGVCLDAIGSHGEAAKAFIKAHELDANDYGIHYRILRSLKLAEDFKQLHEFIDYLCQTFEEEIETIFESDEFSTILKQEDFSDLKLKYY